MNMPSADPVTPKGLFARALGMIFSPRSTFADIVMRPKPLPMLLLVVAIMGATSYFFLSTEIGRRALLDQQLTTMESLGFAPPPEAIAQMESGMARAATFSVAGVAVGAPLLMAIMAGVLFVLFNAVMGGDASFKQVFSIVVHAGVIGALQQLFVTPLNYARESMSSATSIGVFLPMMDSASFLGMFAGSLDLFRIWSLVTTAIGLGVLYKRRTAPIAWSFIAVYIVLVLIFAGIRAARSGA